MQGVRDARPRRSRTRCRRGSARRRSRPSRGRGSRSTPPAPRARMRAAARQVARREDRVVGEHEVGCRGRATAASSSAAPGQRGVLVHEHAVHVGEPALDVTAVAHAAMVAIGGLRRRELGIGRKARSHDGHRIRALVDQHEPAAERCATAPVVPLPAKKSSTQSPGRARGLDDAAQDALRLLRRVSGLLACRSAETMVCHHTSVGSLPRAAFSAVTRPGAMYGSRSTASCRRGTASGPSRRRGSCRAWPASAAWPRAVVVGPDDLVEEALAAEQRVEHDLGVVRLAVVEVQVERAVGRRAAATPRPAAARGTPSSRRTRRRTSRARP